MPDTPMTPEILTLTQRLAQTVARIGPDDLTELAQMHGWSQSLSEIAALGESPRCRPVHQGATDLVHRLEQLIVGEEKDARTAFAAIAQEIRELAGLLAISIPPDDRLAQPQDPEEPTAPAHPDGGGAPAPAASSEPDASALEAMRIPPGKPAAGNGAVGEAPYEQVPLVIGPKEMEYIKGFVEESSEHIQAIEAALLDIERAPENTAKIDELFRPFHTMKGLAGFLNLRDVNCLAHEAETLLDQARKGTRHITPATIDLVFDVVDILKAQLAAIARHMVDPREEVIPQPPIHTMIANLRAVIAGRTDPEALQSAPSQGGGRIGDVLVSQKVVAQEVVDFALQEQKRQEPERPIGELLVGMKATTARQIDQALRAQQSTAQAASAGAAPTATPAAGLGDFSVRIDTAKLDSLVDMVGELVIAHTLVAGNCGVAENARLTRDVSHVGKIVRDIQELAMSMRMVPIGPTFQKMERLVRDLSRKAGKRIEFVVNGQDTELDKNVIQQISDPLVHMVRNAVDHGVDRPEERAAAGKNPVGQVRLSAFHQGGNIVIEIADDGKGLDARALTAQAIRRGLLPANAELSEQEAFGLVFAAGVSTAAAVTDISGRGVGMDVVRRNIEQLRGKVDIRSRPGEGTTFSILLPLTLAIIDGMVVRVGSERFIIPTIHIEQALRPAPRQITTIQQRGEVLSTRGRLLPVLQLGEMFRLSPRIDPCQAMVVIVQSDREAVGVVVDELIGQQQVVIKSLGTRFEKLRGISGAAILGDGKVGLILEVSGLRTEHHAEKKE